MKLHKIEINNFRQFKGSQSIDFSVDDTKNVTVIYGENGRGKTGIFRALMFCLYGDRSLSQDELSGDLKKEGLLLINEIALKENIGKKVEAIVTIHFSHNDRTIVITRKIAGLMKTDGNIVQDPVDRVEFQKTDNSNTLPIETDPDKVESEIQDILNSRLRDYFLFDGERIERLTRNTKERRAEVRQGIRALLDLDSMELANKSLEKLISQIEKEIKYKSTGKLQEISTAIDELNSKIEKLEDEQEANEQESKRLEHRILKISEIISINEETAEKERKRQDLIKTKMDKEVERDELKKEMSSRLNKSGQLVCYELIEQLREELELRRDKGQLPPEVRRGFVEKLLENEKCICGTPLDEAHLQEKQNLIDFLSKHYTPGLGEETMNLLFSLTRISSKNEVLANDFSRLLINNKKLNDEILDLETRIKLLGDELGEGGYSVDDLIIERKKCEDELKELEHTIDVNNIEINRAINEREEIRKEWNVLNKQQSHIQSLVKRRDLTDETLVELQTIYNRFAIEVKEKLEAKSSEKFSRLADIETQKDIKRISIDENYMLDVLNWAGQRRLGEISAGQRQIVSLSFILALIQVAGDLEVPLFMDTPFGRLSGSHRDHLLNTIPQMASQWILLATDTEFTEAEANALRHTGAWGQLFDLVKEEEGITKIVPRDINKFTPKRKTIY